MTLAFTGAALRRHQRDAAVMVCAASTCNAVLGRAWVAAKPMIRVPPLTGYGEHQNPLRLDSVDQRVGESLYLELASTPLERSAYIWILREARDGMFYLLDQVTTQPCGFILIKPRRPAEISLSGAE